MDGFRTWAFVTLALVFGAVMLNSCEAKAYELSVCNVPVEKFMERWADEAGEYPFHEYLDEQDGERIIKMMFVNMDTGTWTLVERSNGTICTWRSGKGIHIFSPPNLGEPA